MAQHHEPEEGSGDPSHALDMVTLYTGLLNLESEAEVIQGILEANGIPSMIRRQTGIPPLGVEIQVPRTCLQDAERIIAEQRAAGPAAADEAEAATEE